MSPATLPLREASVMSCGVVYIRPHASTRCYAIRWFPTYIRRYAALRHTGSHDVMSPAIRRHVTYALRLSTACRSYVAYVYRHAQQRYAALRHQRHTLSLPYHVILYIPFTRRRYHYIAALLTEPITRTIRPWLYALRRPTWFVKG
ncbi:hypothetical protein AVEN_50178-1 [Araneus ventricosus]|uniref:Uncharacterized protein n=1 Tax=Araneus ventricosus TaxID=182803 RepID=A0A4Y2UDS7_ARAVE|nr:hypothetical protein AVEN_50178-1 [Araneus ventricosus]